MSLEEELVELSLAYHGYREENEELRQLVKDYRQFVSELDPRYGFGVIRIAERDALQARAQALLQEHPQEGL